MPGSRTINDGGHAAIQARFRHKNRDFPQSGSGTEALWDPHARNKA